MKRIFSLLIIAASSILPARAADGDSIWSANFIHDIYFTFSQVSYWDSLVNSHTTDVDVRGDMVFDGRSLPSVGVKTKGNSSFNGPSNKKSFKVDLNEFVTGQDYDGIKKFNLNNGFKDPTMMREKICLDFLNLHGIHAPRCTYARVYINGVYWGLYTIVEEINSKFLKQHFPDDNGSLLKGDPQGDLKWYGSAQSSYYTRYELDSDDTLADWNNLVHLIDEINNTPTANFYDSMEVVLDSWEYLYAMAANNMFVNLDSYTGSGHNYYLYADSTYFKFHWISWDVNEAFGNFQLSMSVTQLQTLPYNYINQSANRPLANKMFADPTYHSMYISAFCALMPDFSNAAMDSYIDSLANAIRADVYTDTLKTSSNQQFEDNITMQVGNTPGLKSFIAARRTSLISQLSAYGCWLGTTEAVQDGQTLSVFPNPASDAATILLPEGWNAAECTLSLVDAAGRETGLVPTTAAGNRFELATSGLAAGMYFVVITSPAGVQTHTRLSVQH